MTEIEELRKALLEATEHIQKSDERVEQALKRAEEARKRMLRAAGISRADGQHRH
jgi:hypothetical protein